MGLTILHPGLALSVQAPARNGHARIGVPGAGPMDPVAMAALNALLGNSVDTPALEFAGGTLRVRVDAPLTLAALGDGYALDVDGHAANLGQARPCAAGTMVTVRAVRPRGWAALAVAGTWDLPVVLGSAGTDVRNRIGGLEGRLLQAGDTLRIRPGSVPTARAARRLRWPVDRDANAPWAVILHEPQFAARLLAAPCRILPDSNRQALVLAPAMAVPHAEQQRVSRPQWPGAIQALPDGRFAVLGPEAQTVGGYPLVASLVAAELPRLGRCSAGQTIRFAATDLASAAARTCAHERALADWLARIRLPEGSPE